MNSFHLEHTTLFWSLGFMQRYSHRLSITIPSHYFTRSPGLYIVFFNLRCYRIQWAACQCSNGIQCPSIPHSDKKEKRKEQKWCVNLKNTAIKYRGKRSVWEIIINSLLRVSTILTIIQPTLHYIFKIFLC